MNRLTHIKTLQEVLRLLNVSGLTNLSKHIYILIEPEFILVVNAFKQSFPLSCLKRKRYLQGSFSLTSSGHLNSTHIVNVSLSTSASALCL